jgi:hypothetical protein
VVDNTDFDMLDIGDQTLSSIEKRPMKTKQFDCPLPALAETDSLECTSLFQKGVVRPLSTSTRHGFPVQSKKKFGNLSNNQGTLSIKSMSPSNNYIPIPQSIAA